MSKSKKQEIGHTPAPWSLSPDGWIDAGEDPVCMISTNDLTERENCDAALIIAAPDFQDAVRSLMIDLDETCPDCISSVTFDKLVAALAKSLRNG